MRWRMYLVGQGKVPRIKLWRPDKKEGHLTGCNKRQWKGIPPWVVSPSCLPPSSVCSKLSRRWRQVWKGLEGHDEGFWQVNNLIEEDNFNRTKYGECWKGSRRRLQGRELKEPLQWSDWKVKVVRTGTEQQSKPHARTDTESELPTGWLAWSHHKRFVFGELGSKET